MSAPSTVIIVGTDHHPFDRLVDWTNEWLGAHPELAAGCFMQWGAAVARPLCPGSQFLSVDELGERLDAADVIVCHGGPASIFEAWSRGRMPIVVPRLAQLGEHVDDHQADFCEKIAELATIALARTLSDFIRLLDDATSDPSSFCASSPSAGTDVAIARLGGLVEELASRPRRLSLIGRGRPGRRDSAAGTGLLVSPGDQPQDFIPVASTNWQATRDTARIGLAATVEEQE